jgi:hypothetical protein
MADYYPLIARAVAGLERSTGDARRSLYERGRAALLAQLRSVSPELSESDITRERLALEEAIRKVEAEAARRAKVEVRPDHGLKVRAPDPSRWEEAARWDNPVVPSTESPEPAPPRRATPPPPWPDGAARRPAPLQSPGATALASSSAPGEQRYADPGLDQPVASEPPSPPRHPLRARPAAERRSLLDTGLKDFHDVVSEANELGEASARAAKSARETFAAVPEPASNDDAGPAMLEPQPMYSSPSLQEISAGRLLDPSFDVDAPPVPARGQPAESDAEEGVRFRLGSYRDLIKVAAVLLLVAGLGGALAWQWPNMAAFYRSLRAPPAPEEAARDTTPATRPKFPDRLEPGGQPSQGQPSTAALPGPSSGAAVAQRVVLYEEDPADPDGKRFVGSAIWRTETVSPGPNQPPELAVRADVEIPERKIAMTWSLRRNTDPSLPASHTVEIMFRLPADFPAGGVSNVPGIMMKQTEGTRGVPLDGLAVKVTNGFFLIGLSAVDANRERNVQLLKERAWFDIPLVYNNNRRAILALEKGTPGERVFADAFRVWKQ